ncbi:hypothetical protein [Pseudotabrizicola alkalilacus]|uniref:Uncharacterized protein n=1 Tax=Pseudotabrizicola alkalilacus TaxID=2305252 RepID=A0A411Z3P8_9RHOB|nr:hypothetical protein [Pseudotabrizicola alkalilacus]RGP37691.1 hypothetical protein D1012_07165 [Pseudotabrizicola alkalilacus]
MTIASDQTVFQPDGEKVAPLPVQRSPGLVVALAGWKEGFAEYQLQNSFALDEAWNGKRRRAASAADRAEYAAERGGVVRRYVQGQHLKEGLSDDERRALMKKESKDRNKPPRVRADLSKMTPEQKTAHRREKEREKKARQRVAKEAEKAGALSGSPMITEGMF